MAIDKQTEIAKGLARKLAPRLGEDLVSALLEARPQIAGVGFPGAARARGGAQAQARVDRRCRRAQPARAGRLPGAALGMDRRRRWLGVRHRIRRARPRARDRSQRQRARPRHRGLFQYRRTGIEGNAARSLGQVRRRRQEGATQGPRDDGDLLRQRLRRAGRDGRQQRAGGHRVSRSRGVRRARR